MKVLVTGGCGFIGSNFIRYLLADPGVKEGIEIINIDKKTYAGLGKNLEHMGIFENARYKFVQGDIADEEIVNRVFDEEKPEIIVNFAAESHVDRSIQSSKAFRRSNFEGVGVLLDAATKNGIRKFVQISTDEVYGSTQAESFSEEAKLKPSSPYSSSKAAGELLALSYFITHGLPVVVTRSANNYGPYQFPEKLLPLFITNLIDGKKVPLMWSADNPGLNVRDWLHVEDNCRAIWFVAKNGVNGEVYNIPGENEKTNIDMTNILLNCFGMGEEMIEHVMHRLGHDFRYSIKGEKLKSLGFVYNHLDLRTEIKNLVKWYKSNENWWRPLK